MPASASCAASTSIAGFVGRDYLHDGNAEKGRRLATFRLQASEAGDYELAIAYAPHPNRAANVPILIAFPDERRVEVQRRTAEGWRVEDLIGKAEIRLSCCDDPVPLEAIYRDLLDEQTEPEAPSGT